MNTNDTCAIDIAHTKGEATVTGTFHDESGNVTGSIRVLVDTIKTNQELRRLSADGRHPGPEDVLILRAARDTVVTQQKIFAAPHHQSFIDAVDAEISRLRQPGYTIGGISVEHHIKAGTAVLATLSGYPSGNSEQICASVMREPVAQVALIGSRPAIRTVLRIASEALARDSYNTEATSLQQFIDAIDVELKKETQR